MNNKLTENSIQILDVKKMDTSEKDQFILIADSYIDVDIDEVFTVHVDGISICDLYDQGKLNKNASILIESTQKTDIYLLSLLVNLIKARFKFMCVPIEIKHS